MSAANATPVAQASVTCSDYSNQADAQRAADTIDADSDGLYCESLPCLGAGAPAPRSNPAPTPPPVKRAQRITAEITAVTDGDTLKVRSLDRATAKRHYKVRIIGIDTPEKFGGLECGARDASESMEELAPIGAHVLLITDPSQDTFDRYGRLLAYVRKNGRDLGRVQISRGWATTYVYRGNPFQRTRAYRLSQRGAERHDRGVYRDCGGNFHRSARRGR